MIKISDIYPLGIGGLGFIKSNAENTDKIIRAGYENGLNFIETGRSYKDSEEKIGQSLYNNRIRDSFFLATKTLNRTYLEIKSDIETSLNNLRTDYLDLYQMHDLRFQEDYDIIIQEGYEAFKHAKESGKIRYIGVSAHKQDFMLKLINDGLVDFIQIPINIIDFGFFSSIIPIARRKNIKIIAMKPFAGGLIKDPKLAIGFIINANPDIVIPGVRSVDELRENICIYKSQNGLTSKEEEILKYSMSFVDNKFCRGCGYCLPCTVGIDIPQMFLYERYCKTYFLGEWAKEQYNNAVSIDKCIGCNQCLRKCPYEINIPKRLKEIHSILGGF